jgi:hypothetical protein
MSTITLKYNNRNRIAKKTLDYILSLGIFEVSTSISPLDESEKDIRAGRVYSAKNADDLIMQCLK